MFDFLYRKKVYLYRVWIKRIARDHEMRFISPLSRYQINLILLNSLYKILCKTRKNALEFHLYCWDHVRKVNEWCLVDCFCCEFRVFTQVMVRDYCIAKCKKFSACSRLLVALWANYVAIKNIYPENNLNHALNIHD